MAEEIIVAEDNAKDDLGDVKYTAKSVYTLDRLMRFNTFHAFSKKWIWILLALCTAFVYVTGIFSIITNGWDNKLAFSMLFITLLDVLYVLLALVLPRFTFKKTPGFEAVIDFQFYDDIFVSDVKTDKLTEHTEVKYESVTNARISGGDLYLYISANQAHIVDTSTLSPNDLSGFIAHIYNAIPEKAKKGLRRL